MSSILNKITVVTGTRADYGIYYPVLKRLESEPVFHVNLLVTGMHLSPQYGMTVQEIEKDGFEILGKVDMLLQGDSDANMSKGIGIGLLGMTQLLEQARPDLLIVLGDRGEMLAASIAAAHLNIPIAHFHGGEVSGSIDESVRHSISKFSHIHFPATEKSAERLRKMGEDEWRVYPVGAPRIETIQNAELKSWSTVKDIYSLKAEDDFILLVFHPVTTEIEGIEDQVKDVLEAVEKTGKSVVCIMPNSDAGTEHILRIYKQYQNHSSFDFVTNFQHLDYLTVLKQCAALVGNSSSGIIEAASFSKPVLNIGSRQNGRERSGNVIDVQPNFKDIKQGLEKVLSETFNNEVKSIKNAYGDGTTSTKVVEILKKLEVADSLLQKKISY
ncbi:UDP-N-acetylglucosamine 2-epimerase [Fictibacillus barbaricus]|uniref:UDP-N-acetylglucosamine 2-epimerase (Hydrolyzing) n=1 Tax=Fictibacillus barbaricus TaxID=182136 RepID=A0ABS2ZHD8_9BACL|nr:UDP-N-acetylglucosamine 2-epimerase [Fictibacillus barbaricus]MBN3546744.1 UDP-N-acetylglucosamine 2-epimerase (hydrolyzing) [Fictibacillus barbaricus]GGB43509.1 UDP-N-acetyl glucosamine 2-epimerase [Fictibacillus barbaricus]